MRPLRDGANPARERMIQFLEIRKAGAASVDAVRGAGPSVPFRGRERPAEALEFRSGSWPISAFCKPAFPSCRLMNPAGRDNLRGGPANATEPIFRRVPLGQLLGASAVGKRRGHSVTPPQALMCRRRGLSSYGRRPGGWDADYIPSPANY